MTWTHISEMTTIHQQIATERKKKYPDTSLLKRLAALAWEDVKPDLHEATPPRTAGSRSPSFGKWHKDDE